MSIQPPRASSEAPVSDDPRAANGTRKLSRQLDPADASPEQDDRSERIVLDDQAIRRALMRMAHEIVESADGIERLHLVAIPNGGVPLGRILADNLESLTGQRVPLGILDTTLYRDDLSTRGSRPPLRRTEMPSSVDDRVVVLVEDVVNTGRTIRAAMDALMDFGRPSHVRVVALVDRGHRELPIKIDYVGKNIPTQPEDKVVFHAETSGGSDAPDALSSSEEPAEAPLGELRVVVRDGTPPRTRPTSPKRSTGRKAQETGS